MNSNLATKSIPDMYGVTIHANITHMILEQSFINKLSKTKTALINFLLIFLLVTIFNKIYNKINAGYFKIIKVIQLLIFITLFLIVSGVMYSFNLKLELGVGIIGAVLSWDAVKWYNYLYIKKQPFFKDKNH
jgi:CHASE2 domain-containing sensor protein